MKLSYFLNKFFIPYRWMVFICLLFIFFNAFNAWSSNPVSKQKKYNVIGRVMYISAYCGGAKPTQEVLDFLNEPRSYPYYTVYALKMLPGKRSKKIVATATTDTLGNYKINLPKGLYAIVAVEKTKSFSIPQNSEHKTFDIDCLKKEYKKNDATIYIDNKDCSVSDILIKKYCPWNTPCIIYNGSLPPIAPNK